MKKTTVWRMRKFGLCKKGGLYECQYCGLKYSPEEISNLYKIRIDNSDKINNLLKLARQAKRNNNWEKCAQYYEMVMIEDSENREASFYAYFPGSSASAAKRLPVSTLSFQMHLIRRFRLSATLSPIRPNRRMPYLRLLRTSLIWQKGSTQMLTHTVRQTPFCML